jgi:hypothetical protein
MGCGGALDIGPTDGTTRACTTDGVHIDAQFGGELAGQRRDPEAWEHGRWLLYWRLREGYHRRAWRRWRYSGGHCCRSRYRHHRGPIRTDGCQHSPDGNLHTRLYQELFDHPVLEHLDLDDAFIRFYLGNDVTAFDAVAGLNMPYHQRPGLHISA